MSGGRGVFFLDAGGCGGCALEMRLTRSALAKAGLGLVSSPVEACILLVAGPLTRAMAYALGAAWEAMAAPKYLVALGDCAIDGGVFAGSYASLDGLSAFVPPAFTPPAFTPSLVLRGCPPAPDAIAAALAGLGQEEQAPLAPTR